MQVTIRNATVHDAKFNKGLYIKYKPFRENEDTQTKTVTGTLSPEFNHSKVFHFDSITQDHLEWFDAGCIAFQLFGRQEDSDPDAARSRMTTKVRIHLHSHITTCFTRSEFRKLLCGNALFSTLGLKIPRHIFDQSELKAKLVMFFCDWLARDFPR